MSNIFNHHLLTVLITLPVFMGFSLLFVPASSHKLLRTLSLFFTLIILGATGVLLHQFQINDSFQFVEKVVWIKNLGVNYFVGVDGISLFLVALVNLLAPILILSSWKSIQKNIRSFLMSLFFLQASIVGVFVSLDLVLFYFFWELMLIPMFLLIGVWGSENRIYAAVKFFLFTLVGSILMFAAVIYLGYLFRGQEGTLSFSLINLYNLKLTPGLQILLFSSFFIAFAVKVPMFPLHTWLPDAHVEAPAAGSIILAGVLLKMGAYGFIRICLPLFPYAVNFFLPTIIILALIGIIYGGLVALIQKDIKKLIAYSSVAHMGFIILGIFSYQPDGVVGAVLQMINHGLATGALFLLFGYLYERKHSRLIKDFGGIAAILPMYTFYFLIVVFASIGLPGLNGFVGEFLILLGIFSAAGGQLFNFFGISGMIATAGIVLGAVYLLWLVQRVFFGPVAHAEDKKLLDLNFREHVSIVPLVALIFIIGLQPTYFTSRIAPAVKKTLKISTPIPNAIKKNLAIKKIIKVKKPFDPSIPRLARDKPFDKLKASSSSGEGRLPVGRLRGDQAQGQARLRIGGRHS